MFKVSIAFKLWQYMRDYYNDKARIILLYYIQEIIEHDFYIRWNSCRLTVTRRVLLVEKELQTLSGHLCSFRFLVGFVLLDL